MGLDYFETHAEGRSIYQRGSERGTFTGGLPPLAPSEQAEFERVEAALDALSVSIPVQAPWNAPDAAALDSQTLAGWLDAHVSSSAVRKIFNRKFANSFGAGGSQVSLLYAVYFLAGCGQLERSFSAASHRIVGGAHMLSERMAADLGPRVRTGTPVRSIDQRAAAPGRVLLHADGLEVAARRVVVALNPGDCRAIAFQPQLPAQRALLHDAWRGSPIIKFHAVYREPFWRAQGYTGNAQLDLDCIPSVYDASPPDGSVGILMLWVMPFADGVPFASLHNLYDDADQRRSAILNLFAEWYGPRALDPLTCHEMNWLQEPWTLGCVCPTAPGVLTAFGPALRPAVDRIHWGSTETAEHWVGYINGAIEAGERAAREVLAAL